MVRSLAALTTPRTCDAALLGFTLSRPLAAQCFRIGADGVWAGILCASLGLPVGLCGRRTWDRARFLATEGSDSPEARSYLCL